MGFWLLLKNIVRLIVADSIYTLRGYLTPDIYPTSIYISSDNRYDLSDNVLNMSDKYKYHDLPY